MSHLAQYVNSSVGRKICMALTGLALIGFLVAHLAGNLMIFASPQKFNAYGHMLTSNPLIYLAELTLLCIFGWHVMNALVLTLRNQAARPVDYQHQTSRGGPSRKTLFSSTMIVSGLVILVFVPLHVWTFKYGPNYASAEPGVRDLHKMVVEKFTSPAWVIWYVFALVLIGFHLMHGFNSAFETLGVRYRKPVAWLWKILAAVLAAGFVFIPIALFVGR